MTQFPGAPSGASALEDPNSAPVGGGVPQTSQGQQFLLEEQAAYTARGQQFDLSGTLIPTDLAGDFWGVYQLAEQFAAASGWRYLPTPQVLGSMLRAGAVGWTQPQAFAYMAQAMGVPTEQMPWVLSGMSHTDWLRSAQNINTAVYELTGQESWTALGLDPNLMQQALQEGWSSSTISDLIQKTPGLNQQYGYLKYGYTYNTFQAYKTQNADTLRSRYGSTYTDAQAIENIAAPLSQFHASGGAFGQATPYVKSDQTIPTGFQSGAR